MTDIALIVAVAKNNAIGKDNQLPWHIPEDLRWFKQHTMGKPIVMGRKTFESLPKMLPGRTHIVVSTKQSTEEAGVLIARSLDAALELGKQIAQRDGAKEVMVIGGGTIYEQALPKATRVYRTLIDITPEGDTWFPDLSDNWKVVFEEKNVSSKTNFLFQVVEKAS